MTTEAQRARNARKRAKLKAHRKEAKAVTNGSPKRTWGDKVVSKDNEIPVINTGDFAEWHCAVTGIKNPRLQFDEAETLGEDRYSEFFTDNQCRSYIDVVIYDERGTSPAAIKKQAAAFVEENYGFDHNDCAVYIVRVLGVSHLVRDLYLR